MASSADKSRMAAAWKLFDDGDKLSARKFAEAVIAGNPSAKERQEAVDLLERTGTPPFAWLMAALVGFVAVTLTLLARRFLP